MKNKQRRKAILLTSCFTVGSSSLYDFYQGKGWKNFARKKDMCFRYVLRRTLAWGSSAWVDCKQNTSHILLNFLLTLTKHLTRDNLRKGGWSSICVQGIFSILVSKRCSHIASIVRKQRENRKWD